MAEVAKPYARALFDLAAQNRNIDSLYHETLEVLGIFYREDRLIDILNSPRISFKDKQALLIKSFPGLNKCLIGLILIMIKKGRGAYIETALTKFTELVKKHKGIIDAQVYSAVILTEEQLAALNFKLSQFLGKQVEIETFVDPSLIGGLLIKADGNLYDSTIKKHLRLLKKQLLVTS